MGFPLLLRNKVAGGAQFAGTPTENYLQKVDGAGQLVDSAIEDDAAFLTVNRRLSVSTDGITRSVYGSGGGIRQYDTCISDADWVYCHILTSGAGWSWGKGPNYPLWLKPGAGASFSDVSSGHDGLGVVESESILVPQFAAKYSELIYSTWETDSSGYGRLVSTGGRLFINTLMVQDNYSGYTLLQSGTSKPLMIWGNVTSGEAAVIVNGSTNMVGFNPTGVRFSVPINIQAGTPAANPTTGVHLYLDGTNLKYVDTSGTVRTITAT